jgi:hypothetical protein
MTRTDITHKIFLVEFDTSVEAAKTFLRFQEYYESPEFKGKIFKLKQYIRWYKTQSETGKFTYYHDWNGFNIPGWVLSPFVNDGQTKDHFKNLSMREKALLKMFDEDVGDYYIIGCAKGKENENVDVLQHEIMHGLYYTDLEYQQRVDEILHNERLRVGINFERIYDILENLGYHESVLKDELHAYLVTCQDVLQENGIKFFGQYRYAINALQANYDETMKKHRS